MDTILSRGKGALTVDTAAEGGGITPLMAAAREGQLYSVRWLMKRGAGLNIKDSKGLTAVMHAARRGQDDTVRELVTETIATPGARIDTRDKRGNSALVHAAVAGEDLQLARWLRVQGKPLHTEDTVKIMIAGARLGSIPMVKWVLSEGADLHCEGAGGNTPLIMAASGGRCQRSLI